MTLTLAGRIVLVLAALTVLLALVGVAGRIASGQWDAEQVAAVVIAAPMVALLAAMSWRWDA